MAGKSLEQFIALPEATQDEGGLAFAEVHLHARDEKSPVIVRRVLLDLTYRSLDEACGATRFIDDQLGDVAVLYLL
ncbi:hypothetical protein [Pseudomonas sp. B21-048]|uniref:hypothetical protein n=1 Tax=Pseudomonas sp. B21-048 TaxID=2895490 RepID=UPI002160FDBC|nr:hypothetical protein [Pseudomonas sp. B21-048]UVK96804.1 hypothetical protein LOY56_15555 [Pseudomonas sp. B21-048]